MEGQCSCPPGSSASSWTCILIWFPATLVIDEHLFCVWGLLLGVATAVCAVHVVVMLEPIHGIDAAGSPPEAQTAANLNEKRQ